MGCASSRHNFQAEFDGIKNYNTIGTSFQGAIDDEPKLRPIDAIDHLFRQKVNDMDPMEWSDHQLKLDEHLTLLDDEKALKFASHIYEKGLFALR